MKKAFLIILACLLSVSLPVLMASCGENEENSVPASTSENVEDDVSLEPIEVENGLAVYMPADRPIKIAQFADIHFGIEGNAYHNNKVERTKTYMKYVVDTQKPDLIVCSGDNILSTGVDALKEFVALMESYETPWTFVYGNHDSESTSAGYSKKELSEYLDSCDAKYLLYDAGYVEADANRYGNFSISVLNSKGTKMLGAIIVLDNGLYDGAISSYESITEGQIAWYASEIDKLSPLYTGDGTMPSVVFSHIQLPEYYTAYKAALNGSGAEFIIEQSLSSTAVEEIKTGGPTKNTTKLFDKMKEKASTVAYFCGHAHTFDFQVKMDGIVMGFAPQTGFSTLFENNDMPRKTYVYSFNDKFEFTTECCVEDGSTLGLYFSGTFDDKGVYDEANGTWLFSANFNYGNEIVFSYNGERITRENTQISGDIKEGTQADWKGGFYSPDGKRLVYDGVTARTCTFVYNPKDKTLSVGTKEIEVDPNAPKGLTVKTVNSDAGADAIALWTEAGTKVKYVTDATKGESNWIGNGWRYYVVVDAEGRITYAVLWPLSGYGGPTGTTYYTHLVYSDYNNNPSIKILDGFANDWAAGGFGYTLFEIVVPEGGFAITSHGSTNFELVDMLSQGTVEDYGVANINTRTLYNSNIRVKYDLQTKTISVYTVEE